MKKSLSEAVVSELSLKDEKKWAMGRPGGRVFQRQGTEGVTTWGNNEFGFLRIKRPVYQSIVEKREG